MASVTSWTRMEPLPRTGDLRPALEARVEDPLWLLARQWQTLEFAGEDAGSPIVARVTASEANVDRVALGPVVPVGVAGNGGAGGNGGEVVELDDRRGPLEAVIEAEPASPADTERLRVAAGLHLVRLLGVHGVARVAPSVVAAYAFEPGSDPVGTAGTAFRGVAAGRAPDGARVHADLQARRRPDGRLGSLPLAFEVAGQDPADVGAAVRTWLAWWDALVLSGTGRAWDHRHLEYRAAVGADTASGPTALVADEYSDGRLDWHAFVQRPDVEVARPGDLTGQPSGTASDGTVTGDSPTTITRTVIPVPASYAGMPVDRFWQFEDDRVNFGSVDAGPTDVTRLVLVEFALVYGNDWFVVPVDLRAGSLCTITSVEVVDTFGQSVLLDPIAVGQGWGLFDLAAEGATPAGPSPLFVPPVVTGTVEGDPIESVTFLRDELANMVWAVEHTVPEATGDRLDRTQAPTDPGPGLQRLEGDLSGVQLVYRLATPVPDHWIPFVPVPAGPNDPGAVLERRTLVRQTSTGPVAIEPLGAILEPGRVLRVEEQEVPREGAVVTRSWQLARWTDGSTHLWLGRRKRVGRGEGRSGLRFDVGDDATVLRAAAAGDPGDAPPV